MTSAAARQMTHFVRLLGTKRDEFVEFEFAIDDPELSVELVMPFDEFMEFCGRYSVSFLEPDPGAAAAFEKLSWKKGSPDAGVLKARRSTTHGRTS